jgi:hypothetical protein
MGDWKDLYSEVKKRKMEALNKKEIVQAVEKHGKILAFEGQYEKPKKVIRHMYASEKEFIKRRHISREIDETDFTRYDVVLIGCPGKEIPKSAYTRLKEYVINGGWLITTDWALATIVETIFPGYIRWNRKRTGDVVVNCQVRQPDHPFLDGVLGEIQQSKWASKDSKSDEFQWWLENRSYPIELLNINDVHVLISSNELKKKWGNGSVLVYFDFGQKGGRIIHFISHVHLQKGGKKGKYTSALILTNILDEKISQRMNIQKTSPGYISEWEAVKRRGIRTNKRRRSSQTPLEEQWITPDSEEKYATPSNEKQEQDIGLTATSQILELTSNDPNVDLARKCTYCGYELGEKAEKVYQCKECGALYHENCINQQINKGTCKQCGRILLW